ncbi:NAD(P)-dependent alcohol dehydrogenase [Streptomyces cylindrosporus]|uniref:NAD(P)-dependent alcohol dehydrogenase n=1 Tax=Streptomyces cylindrosporus TaxID=2927583 RepID=A0ABS9Y061_9ACTN|nr:NAD(P)-dependent alcohol dehydrogenase [Streptomyces cylindrosporus]MCI3270564.1 NAD(P)-dependent alcohol dehydrogenase [Streptomyces cylindrosporus]
MKAIVQDAYGNADRLQLRDIDPPVPRDEEVLVRVRAAGVDPSVWHLMTGRPYFARLNPQIGLRKPAHRVRGWDAAGVVEAVGARVTSFKPGDEVFGQCDGSFAEFACGKTEQLAPKPAGLGFEQAAALPVSAVTALQGLDLARPGPGQEVLVIGASGGVGTYAVQLAVHYGARVTGVCGPTGAELVRSLGADDVIDYTREDITDRPVRYDFVLDSAGNRPLSRLRRVLAPRGTVVFVGGEDGGPVLGGTDRWIRGLVLSAFVGQKLRPVIAATRRQDLLRLTELVKAGAVTPVIDRTYPLTEAVTAVRHLESGHPRGKLVITV